MTPSATQPSTDSAIYESASGGPGNDTLVGGPGPDFFAGEAGSDRLAGGGRRDILSGDSYSDWNSPAPAASHDDDLRGDAGNDELEGGEGEDSLRGGPGNDLLTGDPPRGEGGMPRAGHRRRCRNARTGSSEALATTARSSRVAGRASPRQRSRFPPWARKRRPAGRARQHRARARARLHAARYPARVLEPGHDGRGASARLSPVTSGHSRRRDRGVRGSPLHDHVALGSEDRPRRSTFRTAALKDAVETGASSIDFEPTSTDGSGQWAARRLQPSEVRSSRSKIAATGL